MAASAINEPRNCNESAVIGSCPKNAIGLAILALRAPNLLRRSGANPVLRPVRRLLYREFEL